jgi:hypothetical protein
MYVTSGSLADDVFHPETVIASTLVHAYTIGTRSLVSSSYY